MQVPIAWDFESPKCNWSHQNAICFAQVHRRIACPTCRARTAVSQVAYVDGGRSRLESGGASTSSGCAEDAEERIEVKGSYGTKVCHLSEA